MKTIENGIIVNYLEGTDIRTGTNVTSCTGRVNGTYFHFSLPETGPKAVRKLRVTAKDLVYSYQK